jgi:hypothetical protein
MSSRREKDANRTKLVRNLARLFLALALVLTTNSLSPGQARFQSQTNGAWNTAATWVIASGSDADGIPDADDTVEVSGGTTVTVGSSAVDCAILIVSPTALLDINDAGDVRVNGNPGSATISGTMTLSSGGSLKKQGTGTKSLAVSITGKVTISGSAAAPSFDSYSLDPASTFEYIASANQNVLSGLQYGNLTLGGSGTKTVSPLPPDTAFRCVGKVTVGSGVYFDVSTNILGIYFGGDVENSGTLDASVGTTVLRMSGAHWINNGTYLASTTPGFGYQPTVTFSNTEISGTPVLQSFYDLVVEGTTTAATNLVAGRHITIASGATFNGGTAVTHQLAGNWANSGTFNYGTCTVSFKGSTTGTISGSTFYNLVLDNPGGVNLAGNVAIAPGGNLTISNGTLGTGAYSLTINSTDPAAVSLGSNKILGTVSRVIAPGSTGTYRFFSANAYVIPGGTGNPTSITATAYPNTNPPNLAPGADTGKTVKRYYAFSAAGIGSGFAYSLRLAYEQSEVRGVEANYVLWENNGSGWVNMGSDSPADIVNNWVQKSGLTTFGNFTLAEPTAALPIQLSSVKADIVPNSNDVRLTWTTLSEINNYGFFVQRSPSDSSVFVDLPENFVPGSGTTITPKHYAWIDRNVNPGTYFYRLKQVDLDGSFSYSEHVQVNVGSIAGVENDLAPQRFVLNQNYPNPFNPSTTLAYQLPVAGFVNVRIYDLLGREVAQLVNGTHQPGYYSTTWNGSSSVSGVYYARITVTDEHQQVNFSKLVKMLLMK